MKNFILAILILLVVSTISICAVKPDMHKSVIVYNSDYTLVPEEVNTVEKEEIPIMEIPVQPEKKTVKVETKVIKPQTVTKAETKVQKTPVTTKTQQVKTTTQKQPITTVETKQKEKTTASKPVTVVTQTTKESAIPATKTVSKAETKVLTQQEEEIAWNLWRSNLQNKIMQDVKLPILPNGVTFKFTFTVDKYGKISNVQTWSTSPAYTPYAIQYIAPVIRSYQGKDILNFPQGSTRFATDVKGGWKISPVEKFSTPQDYNDVEKVVR